MPEGDGRNLKRIGIIGVVAAVAIVGAGIAARSHSETQLATWTSTQAVPTVTVIAAIGADLRAHQRLYPQMVCRYR
jgi:hypothetical protein